MPDPRRADNWAALLGEWDFSNASEVRFKGEPRIAQGGAGDNAPESPHRDTEGSPSHGIALSNLTFSGGTVEAEFTFEESEKSVGELILAYDPATREMLTAGVGGGPGMFSVREWVQDRDDPGARWPMRWRIVGTEGDLKNMQAGKPYHVRGSVRGSQVRLTVNGIQVLMHPLILQHQITPKTSRYTRCSMSMLPNVSINGRIRSSGQLGRWWYSISPCRNSECVRRFTVFAFNQRS